MGLLQNQNLTLGIVQPEVNHWESTPHLSSIVHNTIIVLSVLTFVLQLCLISVFLLKLWRFDNSVRQALKHPNKHNDIYKQANYLPFDAAAVPSSPAVSAAVVEYEPTTHSLYEPFIHWDLVQH